MVKIEGFEMLALKLVFISKCRYFILLPNEMRNWYGHMYWGVLNWLNNSGASSFGKKLEFLASNFESKIA